MPDLFGHFLLDIVRTLKSWRMLFVTNKVLFRTNDLSYCAIEFKASKFAVLLTKSLIIMRNLYNLKYLALFFALTIFVSCEEDENESVTVEEFSIIPSTLDGRPNEVLGCVEITERSVSIEVWDHQTIDGDIVTIYANDNVIISNVELDGPDNPYVVNYTFPNNGYNYIALVAQNEGDIPPNTCAVSIDGTQFVLGANLQTNGAMNVVVSGYDVYCN